MNKSGASAVNINRFKNGTAPSTIARICSKHIQTTQMDKRIIKQRDKGLKQKIKNEEIQPFDKLKVEVVLTDARIGGWKICMSFNFSYKKI